MCRDYEEYAGFEVEPEEDEDALYEDHVQRRLDDLEPGSLPAVLMEIARTQDKKMWGDK